MCPSQREQIIREGQEEKKGSAKWDRWAAICSVVASGLFAAYHVARYIGRGNDPKISSLLVVPVVLIFAAAWIVGGCAFVSGRSPQTRFMWSLIFLVAAAILSYMIGSAPERFPKP